MVSFLSIAFDFRCGRPPIRVWSLPGCVLVAATAAGCRSAVTKEQLPAFTVRKAQVEFVEEARSIVHRASSELPCGGAEGPLHEPLEPRGNPISAGAGVEAASQPRIWHAAWPTASGSQMHIPEPMVFDLVRPLGARAGELETNVLVLVPLRSTTRTASSDPLGIVPESDDESGVEWAPEVEWAPWNDFAVEFELPSENDHVEAYKAAAQWTLGVHADRGYSHGLQGILQFDRRPEAFTASMLYVSGFRLDAAWSMLTMIGGRAEFGGTTGDPKAEFLLNASSFWRTCKHASFGVETNTALGDAGQRAFLVMPQLHWEISQKCMLQCGAGVRWDEEDYLPEAGFRFVVTF